MIHFKKSAAEKIIQLLFMDIGRWRRGSFVKSLMICLVRRVYLIFEMFWEPIFGGSVICAQQFSEIAFTPSISNNNKMHEAQYLFQHNKMKWTDSPGAPSRGRVWIHLFLLIFIDVYSHPISYFILYCLLLITKILCFFFPFRLFFLSCCLQRWEEKNKIK